MGTPGAPGLLRGVDAERLAGHLLPGHPVALGVEQDQVVDQMEFIVVGQPVRVRRLVGDRRIEARPGHVFLLPALFLLPARPRGTRNLRTGI